MFYIFEQRGFAGMMLTNLGLYYTRMLTYSRDFGDEINFRMDYFLLISWFCVKSTEICLRKICLILLSAKMNPPGVFVEVVI